MGKWIGVPLIGILVPNVAGLIKNELFSTTELFLSYLWFTFTAITISLGNEVIHRQIRKPLRKLRSLVSRITILLLVNISYSFLIAVLFLFGWQFCMARYQDRDALVIAVLLSTNAALLIASIYEIVYLNVERESDQLMMERLDKEKIFAELAVLKSQIDPHFMFNSLNTLSNLIDTDPPKARKFNDNLAKVYRYILRNKDRNLVNLQDEIEFVENYFYLQKLRFAEGVHLSIDLRENREGFKIPPISLQTLVENAIKHNSFSADAPLTMEVKIDEDELVVSNNIQEKAYPLISSGIGLQNLNSRYFLLTRRTIQIFQGREFFLVRLPLIKTSSC